MDHELFKPSDPMDELFPRKLDARKLVITSTPSRIGASKIEQAYLRGKTEHDLYDPSDFTLLEIDNREGFAAEVAEGGLGVCKVCGAAESQLEYGCLTASQKWTLKYISEGLPTTTYSIEVHELIGRGLVNPCGLKLTQRGRDAVESLDL